MTLSHEEILRSAVPGSDVPQLIKLPSLQERPWKWWQGAGDRWAVYPVSGSRLGDSVVESVKLLRRTKIHPLLVIRTNEELAATASRYHEIACHIACPIAGEGSLIPPMELHDRAGRGVTQSTRIPVDLLEELAGSTSLPKDIRTPIKALLRTYKAFPPAGPGDEIEHAALLEFMKRLLCRMGFRTTGNNAPELICKLEKAGWGGDRDHFFHSFQNLFFGLFALESLPDEFTRFRTRAKLEWAISPFFTWCLAALWHDVGYGVAQLEEVHESLLGPDIAEATAETGRIAFLKTPTAKQGMIGICTLLARLLAPEKAKTGWMTPKKWPTRSPKVQAVRNAFENSVMDRGHGAPSALHLYVDFMPAVFRLAQDKQDMLTQIVLMASASLPLHDNNFRDHLRTFYGDFSIQSAVLPFAALLSYVDSIQDDRRDLGGIKGEVNFLRKILVEPPATVKADVDKLSLSTESMLWKAVEARDVFAHLLQDPAGLYFKYPEWMVPA